MKHLVGCPAGVSGEREISDTLKRYILCKSYDKKPAHIPKTVGRVITSLRYHRKLSCTVGLVVLVNTMYKESVHAVKKKWPQI